MTAPRLWGPEAITRASAGPHSRESPRGQHRAVPGPFVRALLEGIWRSVSNCVPLRAERSSGGEGAIRLPGVRRTLVLRDDLDRLLECSVTPSRGEAR
jgi:hypothetical protein